MSPRCSCECFGCVPLTVIRYPRASHCLRRKEQCGYPVPVGNYCPWQSRECGICTLTYLENPVNPGCPVCRAAISLRT